jgi:hypothetical protein
LEKQPYHEDIKEELEKKKEMDMYRNYWELEIQGNKQLR